MSGPVGERQGQHVRGSEAEKGIRVLTSKCSQRIRQSSWEPGGRVPESSLDGNFCLKME